MTSPLELKGLLGSRHAARKAYAEALRSADIRHHFGCAVASGPCVTSEVRGYVGSFFGSSPWSAGCVPRVANSA